MDVVLRVASPEDAGDLVTLWREAAENSGRPPDTADAVTALLGRDPEAVILAEHDGVLMASLGEDAVRRRPASYWPGSRRLERRRRIAASADVAMVAIRRLTGGFAEGSGAEGSGAEGSGAED